MVHRGDRRVGAVTLGLGRHGKDQDRSGQCAHARDERYGPGSREVRGRHCTALARGQRDPVARKHLEEKVRREAQCLVEDDGAKSRDDANEGTEHEPLLGVGRRREPPATAHLSRAHSSLPPTCSDHVATRHLKVPPG